MTTVATFKKTGGGAINQIEISLRHATGLAKQTQNTRSFIFSI